MRWALLFVAVLAARLTHSGILWIEEAYPAAAAIQILHGKSLYRDIFFDKPPLSALVYLLWDARHGIALRAAGAFFVLLCCWLAWRFARDMWSEREGWIAAGLTALFLTFGWPAAVMALAPDLLMIAPHFAAVYLAWRGRPIIAGAMAGVATMVHTKGVFVALACVAWSPHSWFRICAGFLAAMTVQSVYLAASGSLLSYWEQVWVWGWRYAADTFTQPVTEALRRTSAWAGFHSAAVIAAAVYWWRERDRRMLIWAVLGVIAICGGWRFFPRYYFQLLPVVVLAAARGFTLLPRRCAFAIAALLLIPIVRFGPRYAMLARYGDAEWADTAMNRDSRRVAQLLIERRTSGNLLVWGYRPDIYVYTRMPAAAPWLDSQPLTGVLADRHLFSAHETFPELAKTNRLQLLRQSPTVIVDGLGPYNPSLAIAGYPVLQDWLKQYQVLFRTPGSVVYELNRR